MNIRNEWNYIPISSGTKIPPKGLDLEKAFKEKTGYNPNEKPDLNVGVVTGRISGNLAVFDIDNLALLDKYHFDTLSQRTPSGGRHYFFRMPDHVSEFTLKHEAGEIFYGKHYVLVAPSKAVSGRNGGKLGEYVFENDLPIAPFPFELLAERKILADRNGKYTREDMQGFLDYIIEHSKFPNGQHNDALFYGSIKLAGDGWVQDSVLKFMLAADRNDPTPQGEDAVRSAVQRAFNQYAKELPKKAPVKQINREGLSFTDFGSLVDKYVDYEASWIIPDWLMTSGIMMVAAPPESYKTWLTAYMACSIAAGLPFLGHEVKRGRVLIIQQEDFGERLITRYRKIMSAILAQNDIDECARWENGKIRVTYPYWYDNIFFHTTGALSLTDEQSIIELNDKMNEIKPTLVIIDPFYSLAPVDDHFASASRLILDRIKPLRNVHKSAFIFVHHNRKATDSDGNPALSRDAMLGSQLLNAAMEGTVIMGRFKSDGTNTVRVARRFKDDGSKPLIKLDFNIDYFANDALSFVVTESEIDEGLSDVDAAVIDFVERNGKTTQTEIRNGIAAKIKFTSDAAGKTAVSRSVEKLTKMGKLKKEGKHVQAIADTAH